MEPILLQPDKKTVFASHNEEHWNIHLDKNQLSSNPQNLKEKFIGKLVTDGTNILKVTGIHFQLPNLGKEFIQLILTH